MSIYVGNLSYDVTQDDLTSVFAEYGSVKRVQLPKDRETGKVRGFAFVEMETEAEEATAIDELDGAEWMGRSMKVNKAKPRENAGGGNGSFGGGGRSGGGGRGGRRY
ncbi:MULTISPECIES: RNA recognition motif domain-containing protein [Planktothrix]|uniref:RNA-binding protein n=1 Tax=Planktothrix mougeotii LEGE 06226 TaxID=1828728 RepID=A0ABR9U6N3_9CYAN|nr:MULTISPECIES: RNA-binding protein [Planktothrix]MBD2481204.1 RNA-binding protein [Planktothrix sp. FACHB-1365]MBE9142123.1 RNA-binding protein [Planktothrix mougeotii LEGE 06226]